MTFSLKRWLLNLPPREEIEAREREIIRNKGKIRDAVQVAQSSNRVLKSISNMIELDKSRGLR